MRILNRRYYFSLKDIEETPIAPGEIIAKEAELVVRLRSTRGGVASWWVCGDEARGCLNSSPYEPVFRGITREFVWFPPGTIDKEEPLLPDEVKQGGNEALNFILRVKSPIPDPLEGLFQRITSSYSSLGEEEEFHGLNIIRNPSLLWREEDIPRSRSHKRWFDHFLCGLLKFAWRVSGEQAIGVAFFDRGAMIFSLPEVGKDRLPLEKGWYIIRHPLPKG